MTRPLSWAVHRCLGRLRLPGLGAVPGTGAFLSHTRLKDSQGIAWRLVDAAPVALLLAVTKAAEGLIRPVNSSRAVPTCCLLPSTSSPPWTERQLHAIPWGRSRRR